MVKNYINFCLYVIFKMNDKVKFVHKISQILLLKLIDNL